MICFKLLKANDPVIEENHLKFIKIEEKTTKIFLCVFFFLFLKTGSQFVIQADLGLSRSVIQAGLKRGSVFDAPASQVLRL